MHIGGLLATITTIVFVIRPMWFQTQVCSSNNVIFIHAPQTETVKYTYTYHTQKNIHVIKLKMQL